MRSLHHQSRPDGGDEHGLWNPPVPSALQRERRRLFLHMYMAEWQNLACVHTSVTFFPLSLPGSCQITCIWPLITALATRSKPTRFRSMVFRPRTHQNLQGLKPPQKTRPAGLQSVTTATSATALTRSRRSSETLATLGRSLQLRDALAVSEKPGGKGPSSRQPWLQNRPISRERDDCDSSSGISSCKQKAVAPEWCHFTGFRQKPSWKRRGC